MISGIHYNFEFSDNLIQALFELQSEIKDYHQFKTEIYLKVTRNYLHYRWLITYFFGASPSSEKNFFEINPLNDAVEALEIVNMVIVMKMMFKYPIVVYRTIYLIFLRW